MPARKILRESIGILKGKAKEWIQKISVYKRTPRD